MDQVRKQATILLKQIVLSRQWVTDHSTVLVPKTRGVESNPYLENPDMQAIDGTLLLRIPPSVFTTQLSDMAKKEVEYLFQAHQFGLLGPCQRPGQHRVRGTRPIQGWKVRRGLPDRNPQR